MIHIHLFRQRLNYELEILRSSPTCFSHRYMIMSHTALFVVDIQHALALDPQTAIPHASRVIESSTAVLNRPEHTSTPLG
jgi:hypothetical protein